ncbi:hypothetical protein A5740_21405 [Mycobacterium sp. GA-1841]|nr:hypothetical protein A5740_21405 [Mycobacterium sp. GA-1841]
MHQGVMSHGYSTEATVRDMDVVPSTLVAACRTHLAATQWAAVVEHPDELDLLVADLVDGMSETAANYPIGTVLRMKFDRRSDRWRYAAVSRRMVG